MFDGRSRTIIPIRTIVMELGYLEGVADRRSS